MKNSFANRPLKNHGCLIPIATDIEAQALPIHSMSSPPLFHFFLLLFSLPYTITTKPQQPTSQRLQIFTTFVENAHQL